MFASAIVNRVPREDVNDPLVYQCYLEGLAGLILENPGKPSQLDCPFSLATLPLDFDLIKQHGFNIEIMIGAGIAKWEEFLFRMSAANSFGCNYVTEDRRYRFLCLFA
ncbi:hypothetical protein Y032_0457g1810 [Ancylostoma ceylanicum]|uniref:Uncharacterized protein n=1 Tax=Ancylostoma ceylanicum TaxID=53326 RepID=A0A016WXQ4_9BILA|nr:hypothetical protein Y032_0457g1810 [Ancylostoma ceylanicum]